MVFRCCTGFATDPSRVFSSAYPAGQIPRYRSTGASFAKIRNALLPVWVPCGFRVGLLNNVTNSLPRRGSPVLPPIPPPSPLFSRFLVFSRPVEAQPERQKSLKIPEVSCKIDPPRGFRYPRPASTLDLEAAASPRKCISEDKLGFILLLLLLCRRRRCVSKEFRVKRIIVNR